MMKKTAVKDGKVCIIGKNKSVKWKYYSLPNEERLSRSLFFTCEECGYAGIKHEGAGEKLCLYIDDSLNSDEAQRGRFCLDMSCRKMNPFPKRAVKKVMWNPPVYGTVGIDMLSKDCTFRTAGIYAKARNLKIADGGYLRLRVDRHKAKEGQDPHFTRDSLIGTDFIDIREGSYDYTVFEKALDLPEELSCVVVTLEGENYSGNVYFEAPFLLSAGGYNVLPDFNATLSGMEDFNWMGQNLSAREWPHISLKMNGQTFFDDEIFLHLHRFTPIEIDIPPEFVVCGENEIELTYLSDYHDTIPIAVDEAYVLEDEFKDFRVISCPYAAVPGGLVRICVETSRDNVCYEFESEDFLLESDTVITNRGLNVLFLRVCGKHNNLRFSVGEKGKIEEYTVPRLVRKTEDNVLCGSGDSIYINAASESHMEKYLKWYLSENIGNLFTVRQVYHWGGQRFVNRRVWERFTALMTAACIRYVHLSDGRDIESIAANPPERMLAGENFLGRQLHERDGQLFYWREDTCKPMEIESPMEEFYDLAMRLAEENPETIEGAYRKFNVQYKDGIYGYKRNTECKSDMKDACAAASEQIRLLRRDNFTRHTGPSVMFKYFYEQGFDFLGAETMDGSTEALLAFLRGASKAYGKNKYGVHHALQWATFPHDTKAHLRRYQAALLISYMHGATDNNTEEGFWFQEGNYAFHNRLSDVCENHKRVHQDFYKYVQTHSRTGSFYTSTAFIHGRYDGWNGFDSRRIWGMPHMETGDDGKSWELLKIFYPLNRVDKNGMSILGYIDDDNTEPKGYFSGTPRGNVDVIPIERGNFGGYSLLVFAGYNMACGEDMDRLYTAAENGATVVGTWAHFATNTDRKSIDNNDFKIIDHPITDALKNGEKEIIKNDTHGEPLIYSVRIGNGKAVVFNKMCYPGDERICADYKKLVEMLHEEAARKEEIRVICGENVGYTKYLQDDGSMKIYLTPVDWYNESAENREAAIAFGGKSYPIKLAFGKITTVVYRSNTAAWTEDDESEILAFSDREAVLQGNGTAALHIAEDKEKIVYCDFGENSTVTVKF